MRGSHADVFWVWRLPPAALRCRESVQCSPRRSNGLQGILGPFYPVIKRVEQGADLTTIPGRQGRATGQVIHVWDIVVDKG